MYTYDKIKQRENISYEGLPYKQNASQSNLATSSQTLSIPERTTQSVRSLNRPNIQSDHKTFIAKIFQGNQIQGNDLQNSKNRLFNHNSMLTRPNTITNTNTPRTNALYSRKLKDSFNKTQFTPFSSDLKSTHSQINNYFPTAKEKVTPFSAHTSNGQQMTLETSNQNFLMQENQNIKLKETQAQQFVNSQREFNSRRQSLIESQLQNVFEDKKDKRSSFSKQAQPEKNNQNKEVSAKKSQFAATGKIQTLLNRGSIEEKPSIDRITSTEFMQFAKKKSIIGVEPFYQNQLKSTQQNQQNVVDASNPLLNKSPQKKQNEPTRINPTGQTKTEEQNQNGNNIQQAPLIHQLTLLSQNSKNGLTNPSNQLLDQRKSFKETPINHNTQELTQQQTRTSEQIMKDFFPDITTKARFPESAQKKNEYLIQQKKKRLEQYDQIFTELKNKRKTFSKFAFKSHEKQDNVQIRPVLEDLADGDPKGTMSVIDLWSDKNINKFLGNCKLIKDKLLISKIAAIKKKRGFFLDEKKPFLLSRKDELNLINKVYMNEQSKQFQEKYKKQLKKTMQNTSEINRSNLGTQQINVKKLSEQKCTTIGCKHKLCREHLNKNMQQSSLSKKLVEYSLEDEEEVSSSNNSSDSEMSEKEIQQKKINYNYNQFLRQSNIIKAPVNAQHSIRNSMMMQQNKGGPSNKKNNLNLVNFLKINNNMIRDLDYLQEQNDKDYVRLVETINTLQDRIVQQKVNNYEAQSSGNEH